MGWGNGIGIGWPNASAGTTTGISGWFVIEEVCTLGPPVGIFTTYQNNVNWQSGDYVYCPFYGQRVLLGTLYAEEPDAPQLDVEGPVYNSCGI